jgi:hypothetical protein
MLRLFAALNIRRISSYGLIMILATTPVVAFSQVVRICESISIAAKQFAEDRDNGMTKQQLRDRSIRVASENQLDDIILDNWFHEIDWVFMNANRKLLPEQIKSKRFEKCRNELNRKGEKN